jgi:hypothetical protein
LALVLVESVLTAVVPSADYEDASEKEDGEISTGAEVTQTSPKTAAIAIRPAPAGSNGRAAYKGNREK